jgi:hypothetical protein
MRELRLFIERLGCELVACERACEGIVCNRVTGQIPRCLYLETEGRSGPRGAVIVGLNPGQSNECERKHYQDRDCTYNSVMAWFREAGVNQGENHPYYRRLRPLVEALGLRGPILWTELAKCESAPGGTVPLQTFRTCTREFLQKELENVPLDWPLFGIGREAYTALAYRFPDRTVIGVPHPTGSYGHFSKLFDQGRLRDSVAQAANAVLCETGRAVWLERG